jgi:hypothetical protein
MRYNNPFVTILVSTLVQITHREITESISKYESFNHIFKGDSDHESRKLLEQHLEVLFHRLEEELPRRVRKAIEIQNAELACKNTEKAITQIQRLRSIIIDAFEQPAVCSSQYPLNGDVTEYFNRGWPGYLLSGREAQEVTIKRQFQLQPTVAEDTILPNRSSTLGHSLQAPS